MSSSMLTLQEVAAELNISKRTAWRLVNSGSIEGHRVGKSLRVHRDNLAKYLESTKTSTYNEAVNEYIRPSMKPLKYF